MSHLLKLTLHSSSLQQKDATLLQLQNKPCKPGKQWHCHQACGVGMILWSLSSVQTITFRHHWLLLNHRCSLRQQHIQILDNGQLSCPRHRCVCWIAIHLCGTRQCQPMFVQDVRELLTIYDVKLPLQGRSSCSAAPHSHPASLRDALHHPRCSDILQG